MNKYEKKALDNLNALAEKVFGEVDESAFKYDDVECLKCGNVGLTSTGHCRECYQGHDIHAD